MDNIGLSGDSIDLSSGTDYRRNMILAMIFDVEQIKMGLDDRNANGIMVEPFLGGKNGGRNAVADEKFDEVVVVFPGAGVEGQGNSPGCACLGRQLVMNFNRLLLGHREYRHQG